MGIVTEVKLAATKIVSIGSGYYGDTTETVYYNNRLVSMGFYPYEYSAPNCGIEGHSYHFEVKHEYDAAEIYSVEETPLRYSISHVSCCYTISYGDPFPGDPKCQILQNHQCQYCNSIKAIEVGRKHKIRTKYTYDIDWMHIREEICIYCEEITASDIEECDSGEKESVEPTCTEAGKRSVSCKKCKKEEEEEIDPLGHDEPEDWVTEKEPTCTKAGEKVKKCTRCDTVLKSDRSNPLGHDWKDGEEIDGNCQYEGYVKLSCTRCGATSKRYTDYGDHEWAKGPHDEKDNVGACEWYRRVKWCEICGEYDESSWQNTKHVVSESHVRLYDGSIYVACDCLGYDPDGKQHMADEYPKLPDILIWFVEDWYTAWIVGVEYYLPTEGATKESYNSSDEYYNYIVGYWNKGTPVKGPAIISYIYGYGN